MRRKTINKQCFLMVIFCFCLVNINRLYGQTPRVNAGKIIHVKNFSSRYVSPHTIDIWLPPNYDASLKYPVLYMQDGGMLFDDSITWNKQSWRMDEIIDSLLRLRLIKPCVVVGIHNAGKLRPYEYFPQKPFEALSPWQQDTISSQLKRAGRIQNQFEPISNAYLHFVVHELKPFIETHYAVFKDADKTFIAGSSMGGLLACYAVCEYPAIFGGAACLSTHWPGTFSITNNAFIETMQQYLQRNLPEPTHHRWYFDCGDQTLDVMYPPLQRQVDDIMREKGYHAENWKTVYAPGDKHNEQSWSKRLPGALLFLMGTH